MDNLGRKHSRAIIQLLVNRDGKELSLSNSELDLPSSVSNTDRTVLLYAPNVKYRFFEQHIINVSDHASLEIESAVSRSI